MFIRNKKFLDGYDSADVIIKNINEILGIDF